MATKQTRRPTARQREYLSFIQAFTDRWGVPPSFAEIGRHFGTTAPSVNGMVKTLEARGYLARVPGAARTLRVLVAEESEPTGGATRSPSTTATVTIDAATRLASVTIERLVPALEGADGEHLRRALSAVAEALDIVLCGAGASEAQRRSAGETLTKVAAIAQGCSTETSPGRKLPWWKRPR